MPFDGVGVFAMSSELAQQLVNARVSKITHVVGSKIFIQFRFTRNHDGTRSRCLVIDTDASGYSLYISKRPAYNQDKASNLCMLLRKYISNAELVSLSKLPKERVICLRFRAKNELSDISFMNLYIELMGRASNLILTFDDNKIIAALKCSGFSDNNRRVVLPGTIYELPKPQDKLDPFDIEVYNCRINFKNSNGDDLLERVVLSNFCDIGPALSKQLCFSFFGEENVRFSSVSEKSLEEFLGFIKQFFRDIIEKKFSFIFFSHKGRKGISCVDLDFIPGRDKRYFSCFSEAAEFLSDSKNSENSKAVYNVKVTKFVNNNIKRCRKKVIKLQNELEQHMNYESKKNVGDIIMANLCNIESKASKVTLFDWNSERYIDIELDSDLSAAENAQKYYKLYSKSKTAVEKITEQINVCENETEYLESVKNNLYLAKTFDDVELIIEELLSASYVLPGKSSKKYKNRVYSPLKFDIASGFTLFIGKNNLENEWISFKLAEKNDIWFHVKSVPGSHALLKYDSGKYSSIPDDVLYKAAVLCAKHSKAADTSKAEVDYTLAKYVKKIKGAKPGMVIYKNQKTIVVGLEQANFD